ncbi:hypothetical protein [Streptomyces cinereoruber]|uniref:hypothetical protein n=1 Tax=Streptomyces cinereoruber TaxID=67260 RepID=UPI00364415B6
MRSPTRTACGGQHLVLEWVRGNADRIRRLLDQPAAQYPAQRTAQGGPDDRDQAPALANPALVVTCPACGSQLHALCTSHSGTRTHSHDVHRARTAALTATG